MRNTAVDDALERIEIPATLGLDSWAWVLSMLPDDDLVTKRLRKELMRHPSLYQCRVLSELFKPPAA